MGIFIYSFVWLFAYINVLLVDVYNNDDDDDKQPEVPPLKIQELTNLLKSYANWQTSCRANSGSSLSVAQKYRPEER